MLFRLYVKGAILGYRRGLRNQYHDTSLLKIENVQDKKVARISAHSLLSKCISVLFPYHFHVLAQATEFYLGKRVVYIYKAQTERKGTKFRTIWGRVTRAHGSG